MKNIFIAIAALGMMVSVNANTITFDKVWDGSSFPTSIGDNWMNLEKNNGLYTFDLTKLALDSGATLTSIYYATADDATFNIDTTGTIVTSVSYTKVHPVGQNFNADVDLDAPYPFIAEFSLNGQPTYVADTLPVPDASSTMMLLGMALAGVGMVRRKLTM